jgi:pSer/pThr/pTyr-binding forkhead associated (FHA) protein
MPDDSAPKPGVASRASVPTLPPRGSACFQIVVSLADKTEVVPLLGARSWSIGRALDSDLRIDDAAVSRRHALLHANGDELEV